MSARYIPLLLIVSVAAACQKEKKETFSLPMTAITRGDIAVRVQATGTVEAIDPVEIKSKAGGAIIKLPVAIGSLVKKGDLLAQIDPRDVKNKFDQAVADDVVAHSSLEMAQRDQVRKDSLYARHVITTAEHDSTLSNVTAANSNMINSRANLDLARQALEDASVAAPAAGTIVALPVSTGSIITAATGQATGTTLMNIADLTLVRMRVTIDEVEMGNIRVGQTAGVAVDAFPDHPFNGVIEKIEPQAVVTQGVTFFPVLITIDNREGLLMPGMNGEVTVKAADLRQVLQVPIDAVRQTNELAPVSRMFGIPVDTITNQLRRDLVSTEGATATPARYVVVAKPDSSFEMRQVRIGPSDLRVAEVLDGLKEGEKVVMLGSIVTARPTTSPRFSIADNLKRGSPPPAAARTTAAAPATPVTPAASPRPAAAAPTKP